MQIEWPVNTGELNRLVRIRPWLDIPNLADAGLSQSYGEGIKRWAKREPVRGVAYWQGKQIGEEVTDLWWLRWGLAGRNEPFGTKPEDLGGEKVIEHAGRRFRILRAMNAGDAQRFTCLWCKDLGSI